MPRPLASVYIEKMKELRCPYCGHQKIVTLLREFSACKFCGFRSAFVESGAQKLLIVDREMPFLRRRCDELAARMPGVRIVMDKRIVQDELGRIERRRGEQESAGQDSAGPARAGIFDQAG